MSKLQNIPAIIGEIVANASAIYGQPISYKHGTWRHIVSRITTENGGINADQRFPLICLVQVFDEKFDEESEYSEVQLTLLICNSSNKDWYSEERYINNYIPVLYPIYEAFMTALNAHESIIGYPQRYYTHTKIDDLYLPENDKNKLPEILDGVWIQDLVLTIDSKPCIWNDGLSVCYLTPCPKGTIIEENTILSLQTTVGISPSLLVVNATTSGVGVLEFDFGLGYNVVNTYDISTSPDGNYTARARFAETIIVFPYSIISGEVNVDYTYLLVLVSGVVDGSCNSYVDNGGYGISVGGSLTDSGLPSITGYNLYANGNLLLNDTFPPTDQSNPNTGYYESNIGSINTTIIFTTTIGDFTIQNTFYINCKN